MQTLDGRFSEEHLIEIILTKVYRQNGQNKQGLDRNCDSFIG